MADRSEQAAGTTLASSRRSSASFLTRLPTHERRLENGLTVILREDHSAPVVAIVTHVKAGYFNEPDTLVGISHVLEHMYFKGTERRGVGELARETKAAGGYLNAGTIYDYTSYYTVLPAAGLELGLDIQSDALRNSKIDEDELRRELQVIIQEARRKLDNPPAVALESLYETMFDVHPMRRWRIGTEAILSRLTREDVHTYYRNLYRPKNIILVVAGDVDPERAFELIERHYGDMPGGEPVRDVPPEEPPRRGLRFREMTGDILQTYVEWGWRTPGTLHPDTPILDLLSTVLGQGRASRLYRGVRDGGFATSISAHNYTPTVLGVFGISAELRPEDTRRAVEATWRETRALLETPVSEDELERAKNLLEARLIRRHETVEGQAKLLSDWQALGDWRLAEQYYQRLMAVTPDDILRAAVRYLDPELATVLVYRPAASEPLGWDADTLSSLLAGTPAAAVPPAEETTVPSVTAPPRAWRTVEVQDGVHIFELDQGCRVVVKPRSSTPLVSIGILATGGVLHEGVEEAGYTSFMSRLSVKGTTNRSAAQLAAETEALGGAIAPRVGSDLFGWTLSLPARHFEAGLALLADAALRPSFPESELERERRIALNDLEQIRDDMFRYPLRLFLQTAFADHPYGHSLAAAERALASVSRDRLTDWHGTRFLGAQPWVFVVGDVDPERAVAVVARELAELAGDGGAGGAREPRWPEAPVQESATREKAQTALALGFPAPGRNDPEAPTLQLVASIASGLGGRFFDELRERRSLAYTVTAMGLLRRYAGAFVAYIATSPEREDEARRGLLDEVARFAAEYVDPGELRRAQQYLIGAWQIRGQTNDAQLADLADALLLGTGLQELREYEARISAVTPADIRRMAERWFDPGRMVEGIVRGVGGGR